MNALSPLYRETLTALTGLLDPTLPPVSNLSNAAALLWQQLPRLNWAGFYLLRGDTLYLGPFQGKPACTVIPTGKGVCGACASRQESVSVPDVHAFPGHIACDEASRSELVIPLFAAGELIGVLDLDSPVPARFTPEDQAGLEAAAELLGKVLEPCWTKGLL